jgi:hypothetical protein
VERSVCIRGAEVLVDTIVDLPQLTFQSQPVQPKLVQMSLACAFVLAFVFFRSVTSGADCTTFNVGIFGGQRRRIDLVYFLVSQSQLILCRLMTVPCGVEPNLIGGRRILDCWDHDARYLIESRLSELHDIRGRAVLQHALRTFHQTCNGCLFVGFACHSLCILDQSVNGEGRTEESAEAQIRWHFDSLG